MNWWKRFLVFVLLCPIMMLAGCWVNTARFNATEVDKWHGCLGKPLSACVVPADYDQPILGDHYARPSEYPHSALAQRRIRASGAWRSSFYIVLVLDNSEKIVEIVPFRAYAAF